MQPSRVLSLRGGTRGVNVAFRLMDADSKGSVGRSDLINILRAVLPVVQKSKNFTERDAYSTRKVMTFMKTVTDPVTVADFEQLAGRWPIVYSHRHTFCHAFCHAFCHTFCHTFTRAFTRLFFSRSTTNKNIPIFTVPQVEHLLSRERIRMRVCVCG